MDSNEGKARRNNYLGKVPMGFHGAILTIGLCSLNEIRFIGLTQNHMIVLKYKVKFDEHTSYFLTLKKLDQINFFMNELDKSIKFIIQSHELTMKAKVYRKVITWKVSIRPAN